jgi:hypothetical protein
VVNLLLVRALCARVCVCVSESVCECVRVFKRLARENKIVGAYT